MADTIRERIIAAFTARAQALSNLPVERARRSVGETPDGGTPERFVSIWDGEDQLDAVNYGQEQMKFPLAVECIWEEPSENPSIAANALIGEITATMMGAGVDRTFAGLATGMTRNAASPGYPQDGGEYITLTVVFTISYTTVSGDPYTVPAY